MTQDDLYILKYKQAGFPTKIVANRLGVSEEEVERRFEDIKNHCEARQANGYLDLAVQFDNLCLQYQMMGENLRILAKALGDDVSLAEIRNQVADDPEITSSNLAKNFIILRPFVVEDPTPAVEPYNK